MGKLPVQYGRVESHVFICSCESTKIPAICWRTIDKKSLELIKKKEKEKDTPYPKKKKPQQDGKRGAIMIKSNPIPIKWVTMRLENNNTKEVFPL